MWGLKGIVSGGTVRQVKELAQLMAWNHRPEPGVEGQALKTGLIQAVAYADSAQAKLEIAEQVLTDRIAGVRGERDAINLVELDISDEEVKWIDLHVGHALNKGGAVAEFPRMIIVSLTGAATRADEDATLWADWCRRIGLAGPTPGK